MAKISDTTSYPNIAPVGDDYLILTDKDSSLATKTVTVEDLGLYLFGNIPGSLIPALDDSYDIGSASKEWRDLYIDGVARIDDLRADVGEIITLTVPTSFVLSGAVSGSSLITATTLSGASNSNIASTLAIKTYVDTAIATVDDLSGTYDIGTTSVNIPTQILRILGTGNQIITTGDDAQTMQLSFPTNITTPGRLASTGEIFPVTDKNINLGQVGSRWQNFFTENIADETDSFGLAKHFLGKNDLNTALEWKEVPDEDLRVRLTSAAAITFTVDLGTESLGIIGTEDEIEVVDAGGNTAALRLPVDITTRGQLNSLGTIIPLTDADTNLGSTTKRWQSFFTKDIVDAGNNLGVAAQVLAKNAANTGLEWITNGASDTLNISIDSIGTLATSVDLPTQKLSLLGTSNQIEIVNPVAQTIAFQLPVDITTRGQLNSLGAIVPVTDAVEKLGSATKRWLSFFTQDIADANDDFGTANQVLAKSNTNAGLRWRNEVNDKTLNIVDLDGTAGSIDLPTETFSLLGTVNQINAVVANQTITFAFPTDITTPGQLNSGGAILPVADGVNNLGGISNKWATFFPTEIAAADDGTGAVGQYLGKDSSNVLDWITPVISSFKVSDSETPPNVTVINNTDTVTFAGTTNQLSVIENSGTLTFSFPTDITTPGRLASTGTIIPVTDLDTNLGSTTKRWQSFFTKDIVDAGNNLGVAAQVLAKNAANTGLEWITNGASDTLNISIDSIGTLATSVDLPTQKLSLLGTSNQIEIVNPVAQTIAFQLPVDITTRGQLNSLGAIVPVTDAVEKLGSATKRWLSFFTQDIADANDDFGTANQVLAKSNTNAGLRWRNEVNDKTLNIVDLDGTAGSIDLPTETFSLLGTVNQINAVVANQTITFAFPTDITTPGQLNSGGAILPVADGVNNLGGISNKWATFFPTEIAAADDGTGAVGQYLGKDSSNVLDWITPVISSFKVSDSETPPNVTVINNTDTVTFAGTTNQLSVIENSGTLTFSFPTDITTPGRLASTGTIIPVTDLDTNLGSTTKRWLNLFASQIVDKDDLTGGAAQILTNDTAGTKLTWTTGGTAGQVLAKDVANTGLEWVNQPTLAPSLEFLGDTNTLTPTVDLNSESLSILGTANEIVTVGVDQSLTIAFPTDITTKGILNSTGIIIPVGNKTTNLGATANRWQNFFTENIADEADNFGTANQILAKNAGNTGLEWKDSNYDILEVTTTITNAQMLAIETTPIQVAPAPGAGKLIAVVECLWKLDYVAPAFDFVADPFIRYDSGGSNTQYRPFGAFDNGIVNASVDFYQAVPPVQSQGNANGQILINNGLFITATQNPSQGGGSLTFKVKYRVEDAF